MNEDNHEDSIGIDGSFHEENYEVKSEPEDDILAVSPTSETVLIGMVSVMNEEGSIEYKQNIDGSTDCNENDDSDDPHSVEYLEEENPITE